MSFYRFLKKLRLVVNPTLVEGELWSASYRNPSPASQVPIKFEEEQPTLINKYYYERDDRRNYPRTLTYVNALQLPKTQEDIKMPNVCTPPSLHTHKWVQAKDADFPCPDSNYFPIKNMT